MTIPYNGSDVTADLRQAVRELARRVDRLETDPHELWPGTAIVPFHYPHPVTGETWR